MTIRSKFQALQAYDAARPGFPGEHWMAFALGVGFLALGTRGRSPLLRSMAAALGSALIARAASGRDGIGLKRAAS